MYLDPMLLAFHLLTQRLSQTPPCPFLPTSIAWFDSPSQFYQDGLHGVLSLPLRQAWQLSGVDLSVLGVHAREVDLADELDGGGVVGVALVAVHRDTVDAVLVGGLLSSVNRVSRVIDTCCEFFDVAVERTLQCLPKILHIIPPIARMFISTLKQGSNSHEEVPKWCRSSCSSTDPRDLPDRNYTPRRRDPSRPSPAPPTGESCGEPWQPYCMLLSTFCENSRMERFRVVGGCDWENNQGCFGVVQRGAD